MAGMRPGRSPAPSIACAPDSIAAKSAEPSRTPRYPASRDMAGEAASTRPVAKVRTVAQWSIVASVSHHARWYRYRRAAACRCLAHTRPILLAKDETDWATAGIAKSASTSCR